MPTLNWIGKEKVINHHQEVPYKILEPQYTFTNGKENKKATSNNKIIHGDNLEALKSLLPEYEGKIKCIYIDPPYNTGSEEWVYNDNVSHPKLKKWLGQVVGKESEDLSRHDKWLCMMYPRLKLLHKLLADDGAIFISIDDNEQANLKLICDEIFGASNFIRNIIWHKRYAASNDSKGIPDMHDFIITYQKSSLYERNLLPRTEKQNKLYKYDDKNGLGRWRSDNLTVKSYTADYDYPITNPNTGVEYNPTNGRCWMSNEKKIEEWIKSGRIFFGQKGDSAPQLKRYLKEVQDGIVPVSMWSYDEVNHTDGSKKELKTIFNDSKMPFQTPKPISLIDRVLRISTNRNSIILDSFAGSGTTAHAVLNLNKQDGGNRKFILIEMEDYANTTTAERVKRGINGYGEGDKAVEGTGGNFAYYELGQSLFKADKMLNEDVPLPKILEYVWYTETKSIFKLQEENYLLGTKHDTAYYFYYEKDRLTTLNESYLRTLKTKANQYIIYADLCLLDQQLMDKCHIIFRKIPRDITRF